MEIQRHRRRQKEISAPVNRCIEVSQAVEEFGNELVSV
jgi:hypothetical protein